MSSPFRCAVQRRGRSYVFACFVAATCAALPHCSPAGEPEGAATSRFERVEILIGGGSRGSGVLFPDSSIVFTCDHVLTGADDYAVRKKDGALIRMDLLERGIGDDVAILGSRAGLASVVLASVSLTCGEEISLPPMFDDGFAARVTQIDAIEQLPGVGEYAELVVTDRAPAAGTSGAPWVSGTGDLVAMSCGTRVLPSGQRVGYVIPLSSLLRRVKGTRSVAGSLAATFSPITADDKARLPADGMEVVQMRGESPLLSCNLIPGDVILRMDRDPCTSIKDVYRRVALSAPGSRFEIEFLRHVDGAILTATVETIPARLTAR